MTALLTPPKAARIVLHADTAADLMTPNPVSVRQDATVPEVIALLTDRGFTGVPVIDAAGRPVGVVTQTDILIRDREGTGYVPHVPDYYTDPDPRPRERKRLPAGFHVEATDPRPVADIMTPGVFAVSTDAPAARVVSEMAALKVHRLFVVDPDGVLVGVVGLFDVLRHLRS